VRTVVGVALVTVCLGLAGCSLFGKKQAARNSNTNSKPFLGAEKPAKTDTAAVPQNNDGGPLPGANGFLAGRVVVEATEQPINRAYIRVIDPDEDKDKVAPIVVETVPGGFFQISGLKVDRQYKLIARADDSGELISGTVFTKPPQVTLMIKLDKRFTNPSTPPLPGAPTMPKKTPESGGSSKEKEEKTPAASIGRPEKLPDGNSAPPRADLAAPTPAGGSGANPDGGNAPNPANIANGDFQRMQPLQPPSQPATIPSPPATWPPPVPPETQWEKAPEERQPRTTPAVPNSPGSVRLPNLPTPVPSCGLYGNRLDNFALCDLDGRAWEYKHDRHGRLMLLDFWHHNCGACLLAMSHLIALQRDYGPYGLEVIGIACEPGTVEEQRAHVRPILNRKGVNYKVLLSGMVSLSDGRTRPCPVMEQFQVEYFPLLVLIDANGTILWRSTREGLHDREHYKLQKMISDRLVRRETPP
jgi:thiol-disulfide isomerase/thioredoxin